VTKREPAQEADATPTRAATGWSGRSVLVTGAAGFIGSHLVEFLGHQGANVRAFVRYNSRNDYGWLEALDSSVVGAVEIFRGDLVNPEAVSRAVEGCETVFHLGALIPIPYSYVHPREYVSVNTTGTLNILEAVRRHGAQRLVHTSTSEVYGTAQEVPISETHPLNAQSPYAATKIAADQLALSYYRSFETPVVIARPFNTFGPRQSARAVIPTIITQALLRDRVEIGALDPTRDFVFVEDTVRGMVACATTPGVEGEVFNLGTGTEVSVREVVERTFRLLGSEFPVDSSERRRRPPLSEVDRLLADPAKARGALGWGSQIAFDDGLARTIEWIRGSLDAYKPSQYNI
jgi:NAD dependent epimerase/dehydratase